MMQNALRRPSQASFPGSFRRVFRGALRAGIRPWADLAARGKLGLAALIACGFLPFAAAAQGGALVVMMDRGGALGARNAELSSLRARGQRVELRGTCLSSCTLYLGLETACVSPGARFGFHGPSWNGRPLPAREFERWSRLMAQGYREPLRSWFLEIGRHRLRGYHPISGAQLIAMGYRACT